MVIKIKIVSAVIDSIRYGKKILLGVSGFFRNKKRLIMHIKYPIKIMSSVSMTVLFLNVMCKNCRKKRRIVSVMMRAGKIKEYIELE